MHGCRESGRGKDTKPKHQPNSSKGGGAHSACIFAKGVRLFIRLEWFFGCVQLEKRRKDVERRPRIAHKDGDEQRSASTQLTVDWMQVLGAPASPPATIDEGSMPEESENNETMLFDKSLRMSNPQGFVAGETPALPVQLPLLMTYGCSFGWNGALDGCNWKNGARMWKDDHELHKFRIYFFFSQKAQKSTIKREQRQACLNYAERELIG